MTASDHQCVDSPVVGQHILEGQRGGDRKAPACGDGACGLGNDDDVLGTYTIGRETGRRRQDLERADHVEIARTGTGDHQNAPRL
jgi:hypothetical protein